MQTLKPMLASIREEGKVWLRRAIIKIPVGWVRFLCPPYEAATIASSRGFHHTTHSAGAR